MPIVLFTLGLICLIAGAEALVRGASRLASAVGISPLVIGLTVVALGTSSPELAISIKSAVSGQASIAVGNVIGSNIFNVLFILGLSAIIVPLVVSSQLIRIDVPFMIGISVFVLFLSWDQMISRFDGILLVVGLAAYIGFLINQSHQESSDGKRDYENERGNGEFTLKEWGKNISFIIGGLALLVLGSRWLVYSAVTFARYMGISELIVGLTIISAGTSLPEVVTSLVAAFRGNQDIAVGNVVGSNIFNLMSVLGITGIVDPTGLDISASVISFDLPVMIVVAFACLPLFFTGGVISRWEGIVLLGYYIAYTSYLILAASQHDALAGFNIVMLYFILPITAITLSVVTFREISSKNQVY